MTKARRKQQGSRVGSLHLDPSSPLLQNFSSTARHPELEEPALAALRNSLGQTWRLTCVNVDGECFDVSFRLRSPECPARPGRQASESGR